MSWGSCGEPSPPASCRSTSWTVGRRAWWSRPSRTCMRPSSTTACRRWSSARGTRSHRHRPSHATRPTPPARTSTPNWPPWRCTREFWPAGLFAFSDPPAPESSQNPFMALVVFSPSHLCICLSVCQSVCLPHFYCVTPSVTFLQYCGASCILVLAPWNARCVVVALCMLGNVGSSMALRCLFFVIWRSVGEAQIIISHVLPTHSGTDRKHYFTYKWQAKHVMFYPLSSFYICMCKY